MATLSNPAVAGAVGMVVGAAAVVLGSAVFGGWSAGESGAGSGVERSVRAVGSGRVRKGGESGAVGEEGATAVAPLPLRVPEKANDLLVRAARGEVTERAPVWAMRQAGRYLPEFRARRAVTDFFVSCSTPEVAADLTLQPLRRFPGLDAMVIFSDILVVPQAMGMACRMEPGEGPVFDRPLAAPGVLPEWLTLRPDAGVFARPVCEAIARVRAATAGRVPVVGFVGGPWTLLAYMTCGRGSKTHEEAKRWLFCAPAESAALLDALADTCAASLLMQWCAGASVLQIFESGAGELAPRQFRKFALPAIQRVIRRVRATAGAVDEGGPPIIVFGRGAGWALTEIVEKVDCDVVGLDWTVEPAAAVRELNALRVSRPPSDPASRLPALPDEPFSTQVRADSGASSASGGEGGGGGGGGGGGVGAAEVVATKISTPRPLAVQGNLDPGALYGTEASVREEVRAMLAGFGWDSPKPFPLIANLGWGMQPGMKPEALGWFVQAVHDISAQMRTAHS
jgi:uroporphyrinogen decarboxylase